VDRARLLTPGPDDRAQGLAWPGSGIVGLFALLTAWGLWPLVRHAPDALLDVRAYHGRGSWLLATDAWLCMWILSWDSHALTTAPTRLFDANIFHPAPWTLALSEHLLGYWPLFALVYLPTRNPVLAFNATLLLSFVLSAAAMCGLVRHWTGSLAAGVVAGFVFTFAPWRLSQLAHVQLLGLYAAPLVLLFWDRALAEGRGRHLAGLGLAFLLQCLCSYYLAYCTVLLAALYGALTAPGRSLRRVVTAMAALALAAMAFGLVSLPYLWVRASGLLPEQDLGIQAALGVPSWLPYVVPVPIGPAIRPYQGALALALAAVALLALARGRLGGMSRALGPSTVVALVAIGAAGCLLAMGPSGRLYGWLWRWLPGFSSTRVPARFVILVGFAVAGLAGIGWAVLSRRLRPGARPIATALVCAAIAWDTGLLRLDLPVAPAPADLRDSPVHRWLAGHARGEPLLELPGRRFDGDPLGASLEQRYALAGTVDWLPQLTGRSGHVPPSYELLMSHARRLPEPGALQLLVNLTDLGWLVVHGAGEEPWAVEGLELATVLGPDRIYRVRRRPDPDWRAELVRRLESGREAVTFEGTPLEPLRARDLRAEVLALEAPTAVAAGRLVRLLVAVRNRGRRTWPGLAVGTERLVLVRPRWRDGAGAEVRPVLRPLRLAADVSPGAVARVRAELPAPASPGRYRLEVAIEQAGTTGKIRNRPHRRVVILEP
jgi:hypothetical protein